MSEVETRPLLIGEAPSKGGDRYHMFPLSGRPARVLCELAGIPPEAEGTTYGRWTWALYETFECRNVFERYAFATPWRLPNARAAVAAIGDEMYGRVVVCLGRRVQAAVYQGLTLRGEHGSPLTAPMYHEWSPVFHEWTHEPMMVVTIPHPSGLNRALNDREERVRCGVTLREAIDRARAGVPT